MKTPIIMKNMIGFIFMVIHITSIIMCSYCEDENYFETDIDMKEIVDPHSFYYDRRNKKMIPETDIQEFKIKEAEDNKPKEYVKHCNVIDNPNHAEAIFYKRLVNMILLNIDIKKKGDDSITAMLHIEASHSQMEILQNFQIKKMSLREIDAILSDIIRKPNSYVPDVIYAFEAFTQTVDNTFKLLQEYRDTVLIAFGMLMFFLAAIKLKLGRGNPIYQIIQLIFISSFFMTWWHLIQEEEIKSMATQMQFSEMPIACQPDKMNLWHKFVFTLFPNDDCEKYYKAIMSNAKLRVTPALALSHFLSTVILHPITNIGSAVSGFIENATGGLPWMYSWIVKLLLFLCVGMCILIIPFCLSGASVSLGFGPLFNFGIDFRKKSKENEAIKNTERREPVQVILQLPQNAITPATINSLHVDGTKVEQSLPAIESSKDEIDKKIVLPEDRNDKLSGGDTMEMTKYCISHNIDNKSCTEEPRDGSGDC